MATDLKPGARTNGYFSKVRQARELLAERQLEILESLISLAADAKEAGDREVAADILWKLLDHAPRDGGVGVIDSPASKPIETKGPTGPTIAIGISLDSAPLKQLEASVIDVSPLEIPNEKQTS